ncbi:MAG: hypothetical protein WC712_06820 [Candidatus Brocadiia bacterium]
MTKFFIFQSIDRLMDRRFALLDKGNEFVVADCRKEPRHLGIGRTTGELRVVIKNRGFDDIAWTFGRNCILQQHVLDLFFREGLTGFTTRNVHWRLKNNRMGPPKGPLHELIVTGWGGFARPDSGIRLKEVYTCCRQLIYTDVSRPAEVIDPEQWDGSDFFMVWPLPVLMFVSERAAEVLTRSNLRSFELASPQITPNIMHVLRPGRLSDYFPLERARELAKGQDIV